MSEEITFKLSEGDLENVVDSVQELISSAHRFNDSPGYVEELTELRNRLLKARARHQRENYDLEPLDLGSHSR